MSRRHHHHMQPYDYDRFSEQSRNDRDRAQARGIEYQDDSLSSINSDEESYLHHQHSTKDKKSNFYVKPESNKSNKPDKLMNNESKMQPSTAPDATSQRLERLEAMLGELIKRSNLPPEPPANSTVSDKGRNERRGQFSLEPRKHNFTTSMWINKIQEISIQNNWDEKTTISYMGTQMTGLIKAWYNSLETFDYTWPEWKILITKMFPDNLDFVTTLKRLVTRLKQADETMNNYYFSKMYLIEACKITGEDAVSCLIDGLNNQGIQEQAKSQNYLTPETLYSQFLTVLPEYTVDYSPPVAPNSQDAVLTNWYYQEEEPHIEEEHIQVAVPEEEDNYQFEKNERDNDFQYQNFREEVQHKSPPKRTASVHSRLDKRFIRTNNFRHQNKIPMAAKVCTVCNGRGHLARNCRKADKMMFCKLSSVEPNSCYYKNCSINGHILQAFIDTGCTTVAIRKSNVKELDLKYDLVPNHLQVYGGKTVPVLGEVRLTLGVDSVQAQVRAVVVPDHVQDVAVVVGQEFLSRKHICMFLGNETLKIFEEPTKLTN